MDPTRARSRPTWVVPLVCFLAMTADGYDLFAFGAALPGLIDPAGLGLTTAGAAAIASLALVGVLIGALVTGTLTDRFGRRRMLIASVVIFSVGMLGCALAPGAELFGVARFVTGWGLGGVVPAAVALAAESADPRYRSRVIGVVLTGVAIGGVLASLAAIGLLGRFGFRPVFAIGAAPLVLVVPLALAVLPESPAALAAGPSSRPVRLLFRPGIRWATVGLWFTTMLIMMCTFGVTTWLPQIMREAGYPLGSALTFLLTYTVGAVAGTLVSSWFADHVGAKPMVVAGSVISASGLVLLGVVDVPVVLSIVVGIAGFGAATSQNLLSDHIAGFYPTAARATGLGWALGIGRVGAIAGPTYGAILVASGGGVALAAIGFAAPALLAGIVIALLPRYAPDVDAPAHRVRADPEGVAAT